MLRDRGLDSIRADLRFRKLEAILQADMAAQLKHVREMEAEGESSDLPFFICYQRLISLRRPTNCKQSRIFA